MLREAWLPRPTAPLHGSAAAPRGTCWGPLRCARRRPARRGPTPRVAEEVRNPATAQEGADYYSVLGISPGADPAQVKKAYRAIMREFHPDLSQDEDSVDFAAFVNEIYETLIDPDKRAAYDSIAGFTPDAINPFKDTAYPRDLVFVDEFTCIGCRNCNNVCPATFEMEDEYGRARVMRQGVDGVPKLQEAIDTCPVSCIHWVSAPQLALLEDTMAKMERVAAWLLMTGGGKGANLSVFMEASMAWEKRQQEIRARMTKAEWSNMWTPSVGAYAQESGNGGGESEQAGGSNGSNPLGRRATAASVAAAARRWRDYQRRRRNKGEVLLLTTTSSGSESSLSSMDAAGN